MVCSCSLLLQQGPQESLAWISCLVWPLVSFYRLGKAKNPGEYQDSKKKKSFSSSEMIFNALNLWPEIGLANNLLPSKPTDESGDSDDFDPWGTIFGDVFYCHNLLEGGRHGLQ